MNWTPVFYAWGFFVFTTILALIGIQVRSRRQPAFRSGARSLVLLLGLSLPVCRHCRVFSHFHLVGASCATCHRYARRILLFEYIFCKEKKDKEYIIK